MLESNPKFYSCGDYAVPVWHVADIEMLPVDRTWAEREAWMDFLNEYRLAAYQSRKYKHKRDLQWSGL